MISIIDASDNIQFKNEKQNTELQKTINATVNHEIRNPLNSIVAINIKNNKLIKQIKDIATNVNGGLRLMILDVVFQLEEGNEIQNSSA